MPGEKPFWGGIKNFLFSLGGGTDPGWHYELPISSHEDYTIETRQVYNGPPVIEFIAAILPVYQSKNLGQKTIFR